jgi:ParB family transcriptional regulator, chromosome partitioning protein
MCFKEKIVKLSEVDASDHSFRITTQETVDDLMDSIGHVGVLNLPLLLEKKPRYIILSGFRRIEACRRLDRFDVNARILDSDTKKLECARYAITDNAFQRPLNLIEKSRSIRMLSNCFSDHRRLSKEMSILGVPCHESMIIKIKDICSFSKPLQNSILSESISLAVALELHKMSKDVEDGFVELFSVLKLGVNKQREILTLIKEISLREDIPMAEILEGLHLKRILNDEDLDKNQKIRKIRSHLKQRRFPAITRAERWFEEHRQNLKLGSGIKLIPPDNFESPTYFLNFSFKDLKELKHLKKIFDSLIKNPSLKKILD